MAAAKSKTYVSPLGASERVLGDGRLAVPGEPVTLEGDALKDEHNLRLIETGQLLETKTKSSGNGGEE